MNDKFEDKFEKAVLYVLGSAAALMGVSAMLGMTVLFFAMTISIIRSLFW